MVASSAPSTMPPLISALRRASLADVASGWSMPLVSFVGEGVVLGVGLVSAEVVATSPDGARALGVLGPQGRDRRLGVAQRAGEPVDRGALDAELGEQLQRACVTAGRSVAAKACCIDSEKRPPRVCDEQLEPRLGVDLGVDDGGDELRHAGLKLPELGDPGAGAQVFGVGLAHRPAEVEHRVELVALLGGQVGVLRGLRPMRSAAACTS